MAEYIFNNSAYRDDGLKDVLLIQDFVDLDSDKWLQYAQYTTYPQSLIYKTENKRLFRYEVEINKAFDYSVFVAQREMDIFKTIYAQAKNIRVIPNGVSADYFQPKHEFFCSRKKKKPVLVFTGMMNYFANEDGVRWFCQDIFPQVRSSIPEVQFYIVGNQPTHTVRKLNRSPGVKVTGYVDDIRDYYQLADICVIPLRIARGLQNKVLEAMAAGKAVVATSNASDGISCSNEEDIVIANDSETFANQVISLLNDPERCKILGQNAVKNVKKNYDWDTNLKAFDALLRSK
jgi:sugar transferase (PEP-CTERM/EpsH1 system associated)